MVNDDLPPSGVTNAILCLTQGPSISFSDKDLATPDCRSLPLCLTINLNGVSVDSTLIDTGASINVCPMKTLKQLGLGENNLEKSCSTIAAYDNSKRVAKGKIALKLEIGLVTMSTEFLVLDVDLAYKAILGRPWLEQTLGVPSTAHQCFKFPYNGRIIKIKIIPTLETLNAITSEQMPHLFVPDKGKKPVMSLFDFPTPSELSQPPKPAVEPHVPCLPGKGWEVMANIGRRHHAPRDGMDSVTWKKTPESDVEAKIRQGFVALWNSLCKCPAMSMFAVELDGKRSGRRPIGSSNRRRVLWHLGDVLEREWLSRRLDRRLEMLRHLSRRSLCHRTHTVVLFRHRRHLLLKQLRD
ncbi:hypothetical protein Taro_056663 [Colocasia esculenta]|uniref:Peptidase A2 domain-containing protein n=1 Tax=Colocasia esculenta TaxID=4460 RepID=A0A843XY32_COLES|nr:hypothetical protein [Colocasia esculenta]